MNRQYYPGLDETVYRETLECGLQVAVVPRKDFTKKLAYLVTDFGSIHTEFELDGEHCRVPAGIAHYHYFHLVLLWGIYLLFFREKKQKNF